MKHPNFIMLKSALKKPCANDITNDRRVSFSKTVQIYGNSLKPECVPDKYDENVNNSDIDIKLFSIESMIQAMKIDTFDSNLNVDPADFLVHKVVYDNEDQLNDSSEDLKIAVSDNQEFSPNNSDAENEEFVVHQVTIHEDDASEDSESENNSQIESKEETICQLSVQNIQQHNKLTENQLLLDCEVTKPMNLNSDVTLSPPLQELGVNRIICPQSDKWFWNLDISPLNSVQESDSESNVSSEDTMIMMTSEECAKNEQKIQESLQKFKSLKKQLGKPCEPQPDLIPNQISSSNHCDSSDVINSSVNEIPLNISIANAVSNQEIDKNSMEIINPEAVNLEICDTVVLENVPLKNNVAPENPSAKCLPSHLVAVEIPKDVREWKISIDKGYSDPEYTSNSCEGEVLDLKSLPVSDSFSAVELGSQANNSLQASECYADELEHFVDQCTERVERIRKRYSINESMLWTPRRGIRPRFGSSTAILQHLSNANPSLLPSVNINNNHYSWPYYVPDDHIENHKFVKPHSTGVLTNFVSNFQHKTLTESVCPENISIGGLQQFFRHNGQSGINWSLVNGHVDALLPLNESNYPKDHSASFLKSNWVSNRDEIQDNSESIVYYSMQV